MSARWKFSLFGRFRLTGPDQEQIELNSRRLEALSAILVVNAPKGVSRAELSEILWPGAESKQSLRQALFELRRIFGPNSIDSSATWCRLSDDFRFESDVEKPELRTAPVFMPGVEGEWFDQQRMEFELQMGGTDAQDDPIVATLEWLARRDAKAFFQLFQTSPNLARGLEFEKLRELVAYAHRCAPEVRGWSHYWRGVAEEDLVVCAKHLAEAFGHAQRAQDSLLASEVTLELGKVYARLGKLKSALRLCSVADDIAEASSHHQAIANCLRLRGIVKCYFDEFDQGIFLLERSEQHVEDALGRAISQASRAYFLASCGRSEESLDLVNGLRADTAGLKHARIEGTANMARAIAIYRLREQDSGSTLLLSMLDDSLRTGFTQHGVCAAELLAQISLRESNPEQSHQYVDYAARGRAVSKAAKTPLERHREALLFS